MPRREVRVCCHWHCLESPSHSDNKKHTGTSLVIQWLRLLTPRARNQGSIPSLGTGFHMPLLKDPSCHKDLAQPISKYIYIYVKACRLFFSPHHTTCRILVPQIGVWTNTPCSGSMESYPLDYQGILCAQLFYAFIYLSSTHTVPTMCQVPF